jgi:hexosaminidase
VLTARAPVCYSNDAAKAEAETLAAKLRAATGLPIQALPVSARERGQIGAICLDLEPSFEAHGGKEGYMMSVGGGGVRIGAGTATGLANGGKILLQLLPAAGSVNPKTGAVRWTMPCGKLADLPGMPDEVKSLKRE